LISGATRILRQTGGLVLLSVILIWKNCIYYFSRQANCLLLSFKAENIFQIVKPGPAG
jgi:hypothetical protein